MGQIDDPIPASVLDIARALIRGDETAASSLARRIDSEHLARHRLGLFASVKSVPRLARSPVSRRMSRSSISETVKLRAFRRDRFTCRLCMRRTIYLPVLQAMSRAIPAELPYRSSWAFGTTHLIYWTHSTSLEHLTPLARMGMDDESNFVTSCYACNSARGDRLLEEIDWCLHEPDEAPDWDGLSGLADVLIRKYPLKPRAPAGAEPIAGPVGSEPASEAESDAIVPLRTASIDAAAVRVGHLIRVAAEGRSQRRMHRIEAVSDGIVTMREMWRENGRWVASRVQRSTRLEDSIELVAIDAPESGAEA